jgi:hypothetical protein
MKEEFQAHLSSCTHKPLQADLMPLGGKHRIPGFDQLLEDLRADMLMMAALVRRSLSNDALPPTELGRALREARKSSPRTPVPE